MTEPLPLPPFHLRQRVGAISFPDHPEIEALVRKAVWWDPDPARAWINQGARLTEILEAHVPDPIDGMTRILDFGCGAGRVLRHFVGRGPELHGAELDTASVAWLRDHATPAIQTVQTTETPGLPYPDDYFNLVYAYSVFTHLTDEWAGWLLELRRVLKPGGVLAATVIGTETASELGLVGPDEPPGMRVHALGNPWDAGGPVAVHDPSWIAEHWGRAVDVVGHHARVTDSPWPHDLVIARAPTQERDDATDLAALLAGSSDGVAEGRRRRAQLAIAIREAAAFRATHEAQGADAARYAEASRRELAVRGRARAQELEAESQSLRQEHVAMLASRSLRITRPLRALGRRSW